MLLYAKNGGIDMLKIKINKSNNDKQAEIIIAFVWLIKNVKKNI